MKVLHVGTVSKKNKIKTLARNNIFDKTLARNNIFDKTLASNNIFDKTLARNNIFVFYIFYIHINDISQIN